LMTIEANLEGLHRIWCRVSFVEFPPQRFATNCLLDE
jgi:hypothetical protein